MPSSDQLTSRNPVVERGMLLLPMLALTRNRRAKIDEPARLQTQPMKAYDRWPILVLTIWLAMAVGGCLDSQAQANGSTKPRQAYRTESATTVPLPDLANRLAFTRDGTLFSTNTDGTGEQAIPLVINISGRAAWSSDGAYLALADEAEGGTDIFILPLERDGTPIGRYNITQSPDIRESSPAWSPDGHKVAYSAVRSGNWGIYVIEIGPFSDYRDPMIHSDRRVSQHVQSLRCKGDPVWSRDGERLSYTSDVGTRWQITTVALHGPETVSQPGTEIPLTGRDYPSSAVSPHWSPDGSQLVFSANPNGNWDLFIVDADGTSLRPLTRHSADDWNPAWSPDSGWIAFTSNRSGNSDIYLITTDGASIARLTVSPDSEDSAAWLPLQSSGDAARPQESGRQAAHTPRR